MTPVQQAWVRVKRNRPCPVCGRPDWCLVAADGTVCLCPRTPNGHPVTGKRSGEFVGYLHRINGGSVTRPGESARRGQLRARRRDFALLATQYAAAVDAGRLADFSERMGLGIESLKRLGIGWAGDRHAWSFPMVDGDGRVIGIRLRTEDGAKFAVTGSQNGLLVPHGMGRSGLLLVCEGPTSCAALLDLGYDVIGRPSCSGGLSLVRRLLEQIGRRDVVVFGAHDEAKRRPDGSAFFPGQEGAARLARAILPVCRSVKVLVPPSAKDPRDWKRSGATRAAVDAVIRAMNYVRPHTGRAMRARMRADGRRVDQVGEGADA